MKINTKRLALVLGLMGAVVAVYMVQAANETSLQYWVAAVTGSETGTAVSQTSSTYTQVCTNIGYRAGMKASGGQTVAQQVQAVGLQQVQKNNTTFNMGQQYSLAQLCAAFKGGQNFGFMAAGTTGSAKKTPMTVAQYLAATSFKGLSGLSPNSGGSTVTSTLTEAHLAGLSNASTLMVTLFPLNPNDHGNGLAWFAYTHTDGNTYALFLGDASGN